MTVAELCPPPGRRPRAWSARAARFVLREIGPLPYLMAASLAAGAVCWVVSARNDSSDLRDVSIYLLLLGVGPLIGFGSAVVMFFAPIFGLAWVLTRLERWWLARRAGLARLPWTAPPPGTARERDPAGHYDALELDPRASMRLARDAYRRAARAHHPDRGGDLARMQRVNAAWAVLGDPEGRRTYDPSWT